MNDRAMIAALTDALEAHGQRPDDSLGGGVLRKARARIAEPDSAAAVIEAARETYRSAMNDPNPQLWAAALADSLVELEHALAAHDAAMAKEGP